MLCLCVHMCMCVCACLSYLMPKDLRHSPAAAACCRPRSVSGTSTHPVKRLVRPLEGSVTFHILSPCLRKTTRPIKGRFLRIYSFFC